MGSMEVKVSAKTRYSSSVKLVGARRSRGSIRVGDASGKRVCSARE